MIAKKIPWSLTLIKTKKKNTNGPSPARGSFFHIRGRETSSEGKKEFIEPASELHLDNAKGRQMTTRK